jgi:hypothetical protein
VDLPAAVVAVIERSARLTAAEFDALDEAERTDAWARLVAWDVLKSQLRDEPHASQRLTASESVGRAVGDAARTAGVAPPDDDYWRSSVGPGGGALRAARCAAVTMIAPSRLDPDLLELLLRPWTLVIDVPDPQGL